MTSTAQLRETNKHPWLNKFVVEERYVRRDVRPRLYLCSWLLIGLGASLFVVILFGVLQDAGLTTFDRPVEQWINLLRTPGVTVAMVVLTITFGPVALPIIVLVVTALWLILAKHAWRPFLLAAAMAIGVGVATGIAFTVQRQRPPSNLMLIGNDTTFSFPSGHVLGASDFLIIGAYLIVSRAPTVRRALIALTVAWLVVLAEMFSRLYLGYHWLTDALASLSLSMVIVGAVIAFDTWRTVRVAGEPVAGRHSMAQSERS